MESQICITDFQVSYANQLVVGVVGFANHGVYFTHEHFLQQWFPTRY